MEREREEHKKYLVQRGTIAIGDFTRELRFSLFDLFVVCYIKCYQGTTGPLDLDQDYTEVKLCLYYS